MTAQQSDEPRVGRDLGQIELTITPERVADYLAGLGLDAPSEAARTAFGVPVAPSMLVHLADGGIRTGSGYPNAFGTLWTRQEWELRGPLVVGQPYRVSGTIVDVYPYRDRMVVLTEAAVRDGEGAVVGVGRHHQSYIVHQRTGEVKLRSAAEKQAPQRYPVPAGEELPAIERTITLEMCERLFPGSTGYHTNVDAAKELGFRNVVVGGRVTMYYVGEVLERHFGRAWWEGGRLEVKFTNPVWPEDRLAARGVLTGVVDGRRQVELWVEKADGTVVNVSRASLPA